MGPPESDSQPYLSVAITALNEGQRLPGSLDTLLPYLERLGRPYEVVINDDGSTDNTAEVVQTYMARYPGRVRLVRSQGNQGKGAGVRRAVLESRGHYILFS